MRTIGSLLLAAVLCIAATTAADAQVPAHRAFGRAPVTLSVTLPTGKPALSTRGLLLQSGAGMLGGLIGMSAVGLPLMFAAWGEASVDEGVMLVLIGGAYLGGTTAGIHYAGRAQGMKGNPWATTAGTLAGIVVGGALMQPYIDDEGNAEGPAPLLVFVVPAMGGTAGYALTRSVR
jgi:hypothetical protein